MSSQHQVVHLDKEQKFAICFENGEQAVLEYRVVGEGLLDFYHTETPASKRGQGIAGILTKGAMDYVKEHKLKVRPTCWYVRDNFLPAHPEYKDCVE
jgi:predicted GNAT family acetyltransferase